MAKRKQTVIIVTAYGEDNYYQKANEDVVGIYTSVENAIRGAQADGMTKKQKNYLDWINAFYCLDEAICKNKSNVSFQVDYEEEINIEREPCTSAYMFKTFTLD